MPHRIYHFGSFLHAWQPKLLASALGAFVIEVLDYVAGLYGQMLVADPILVFTVANLLVLDMATGVAAAKKRGVAIQSRPFRRTGWKVIEYTAIGLVGINLANAFSDGPFHFLTDGFDDAALIYIALTEAFSVFENVTGSRAGAKRLLRRITDLATGRTHVIEEVVTERPAEPPPPADPS